MLFLDYLQRIERKLADIRFDINNLVEQHQVLSIKMNSNITPECSNSMSNDDKLNGLSFPLKTLEEMESLQCMLSSNDESLKEHMVSNVSAIHIYRHKYIYF